MISPKPFAVVAGLAISVGALTVYFLDGGSGGHAPGLSAEPWQGPVTESRTPA